MGFGYLQIALSDYEVSLKPPPEKKRNLPHNPKSVTTDSYETAICLHLPHVRFVSRPICTVDISDFDVPQNSFYSVNIDL